MKRTALICWLVLGAIGPARAGGAAAFGSYWSPDDADDAFGGGVKAVFVEHRFGLEMRATYFPTVTTEANGQEFDLSVTPLDLGLVFQWVDAEKLNVNLMGGAGYYLLDSDEGEVDDDIGWYAGLAMAGLIDYGVSLFGEILYRDLEQSIQGRSIVGGTARGNIEFFGFGVNVGLKVRF